MIHDATIFPHTGTAPLIEGLWLLRRDRQERLPLPVRTWFGAPLDPDTGEEMDRSPRWQIQIAGILIDGETYAGGMLFNEMADFWPQCTRHPIDQADYNSRIERADWAALYDPNDAFADLSRKIDPMTVTLPFSD